MKKLNFLSQVELINEELDNWFVDLPFDAYYEIFGNDFLDDYEGQTPYRVTSQELAQCEWMLLDVKSKAYFYDKLFDKYISRITIII